MRTPTGVYYWHEQGLTPRWLSVMHGVAALMLGLLLLIQPNASPIVIAESLGAYWLVTGVLGFVSVMMDRTIWGVKVGSAVLGVLGGLWVIRSPLWSDAISPERSLWIAGLLGVALGTSQLIVSPFEDGNTGRLVGALNVVIGICLAFNPVGRVVALPLALGTVALLAGAAVLWVTWRANRSAPKVQPQNPPSRPGASGPKNRNPERRASSAADGSAREHAIQAHAEGSDDLRLLGGRYRLELCTYVDRTWEVWRGTDASTGRPVTIRLTTQRHSGDAYVRACNEAQLVASRSFSDSRVVPVLDAGTDECGDYLVSATSTGLSLEELVAHGPIPAEFMTQIAMELCRLLTRARQTGVVHGPLLPRTVFIGGDGSLEVSDFFIGDIDAPLPIEARPYSAPEQRTVVVGSPAEEVYNVGALLGAASQSQPPVRQEVNTVKRGAGSAGSRKEAETGIHAIWRKAVSHRASLRHRDLAEMMDDLRMLDELESTRRRVQPTAAALAMGVGLALMAASFSTAYVAVPSVIGMDSARAVDVLDRAGLVPQAPHAVRGMSDTARAIVVQTPPPGAVVAPRTTVRLRAAMRR